MLGFSLNQLKKDMVAAKDTAKHIYKDVTVEDAVKGTAKAAVTGGKTVWSLAKAAARGTKAAAKGAYAAARKAGYDASNEVIEIKAEEVR